MSRFEQASAASELASQKKIYYQFTALIISSASITHLRGRISKKRSIITPRVDHSSALIIHLRRSLICVDHLSLSTIHLRRPFTCVDYSPVPTIHLRRPLICADHPSASTTAASITQLQFIKKPFSYNSHEKAAIQMLK